MPYESMLRWLAKDVMSESSISSSALEEMLLCARRIDQSMEASEARSFVCGVECHHDASGRVDFGILVASEAQASEQMLPEHNFLEFDAVGDVLVLGGVFQTVNPPATPAANDWHALREYLALRQFSQSAMNNSSRLNSCFDLLGMPEQIGFMAGRGDVIKLVMNPYRTTIENIATILHAVRADAGRHWPSLSTPEWCAFLMAPEKPYFPRLSIDIDLAHDRFLPRLGIEIADIGDGTGGFDETVVDFMRTACVSPGAVEDMQRLWQHFPVGVDRAPMHALPLLASRAMHPHRRTAHVSHIKVVVTPSEESLLKSYIEVRQEKQADSGTAGTGLIQELQEPTGAGG